MVSADAAERIRTALAEVMDPEIPVVSVVDLGIVREVRADEQGIEVVITPTYTGCPATAVIEQAIRARLDEAGFAHARLTTALAPPWTTDWISEAGRERLRAYGIAPPAASAGRRALFSSEEVPCPRCGSRDTEILSEFGSTPCKAQWRCRACREPFDHFKCH
jgi:ring-1,2-phenylacetyl-CoA epoxidase subunit PaaD